MRIIEAGEAFEDLASEAVCVVDEHQPRACRVIEELLRPLVDAGQRGCTGQTRQQQQWAPGRRDGMDVDVRAAAQRAAGKVRQQRRLTGCRVSQYESAARSLEAQRSRFQGARVEPDRQGPPALRIPSGVDEGSKGNTRGGASHWRWSRRVLVRRAAIGDSGRDVADRGDLDLGQIRHGDGSPKSLWWDTARL